jgi:molecular chaperone GrpE
MQKEQQPDAQLELENTAPEPAAEPELAPAAEAGAADAQPAADAMPSLQESLRQAELKAAEHHDAWLRAKADAENIRRRAQDDIAKASKFAGEKFAQAMLPVKDSLEAALTTENVTLESLKEGVELTLKQLVSAFSGAGVSEEDPAGEKFDPNKHQAISAVEADGEPNRVLTVLQKGYLLHDRVIRPALVMVSKAKAG